MVGRAERRRQMREEGYRRSRDRSGRRSGIRTPDELPRAVTTEAMTALFEQAGIELPKQKPQPKHRVRGW